MAQGSQTFLPASLVYRHKTNPPVTLQRVQPKNGVKVAPLPEYSLMGQPTRLFMSFLRTKFHAPLKEIFAEHLLRAEPGTG